MNKFKNAMVVLLWLAIAVVCIKTDHDILGGLALTAVGAYIFLSFIDQRERKIYRRISDAMVGATMEEKLQLLENNEELWLSYASKEEVLNFRDAAAQVPQDDPLREDVDYILERAEAHDK